MNENFEHRILWVDDDINDIFLLLHPLQKKGIKIEKSGYLPEAYDLLKKDSEFDLIVLDLLMPITDRYGDIPDWLKNGESDGTNGIKLLHEIRRSFGYTMPVLILSVVPDAIAEMNIDKDFAPVEFVHKSTLQIQNILTKIPEMLALNQK